MLRRIGLLPPAQATLYPTQTFNSLRSFSATSSIMGKSDEDVIKEFGELVNMSAPELEKWLKSSDSTSSGWTNGEGGETVGHNSGTKIVDILKRNPDKKKDKYTDEDLKHMRKVVSYNKRHLAQEKHLKEKKGEEELKKTKSYKSLKNESHAEGETLDPRNTDPDTKETCTTNPHRLDLKTDGSDPSTSSSSTTPNAFRSDVALPTALNLGKIGTSATTASTAAASSTTSRLPSHEYLDNLEENINKSIDSEIETLLNSYKELVSLATVGDKDKPRLTQEAFQTEARADIMVRATQNLTLLSESLKLSLLMSKSPDPALNDEALELMESTEREKAKCAKLLGEMLGLDEGAAAEMVEGMDRSVVEGQTREDVVMGDVGGG